MSYKESTQQEKYDEYKEAMISIRHYSNLRFAILTVFSSLMLLVFKFIFNLILNDTNISDISITLIKPFICIFGFVLTTIFLYLERVLNSYMVAYEEFAKKIRKISHLNYRNPQHAPEALIVLYSIVNFIWLYLLCSSLTIPSLFNLKFVISFVISLVVTLIIAFIFQKVKTQTSSVTHQYIDKNCDRA